MIMSTIQNATSDRVLVTGWALIALSLGVFCMPLLFTDASASYFGFFVFNFAISIVYFFLPRFRRSNPPEHHIHYNTIKLVLFLISAYALNRELDVFASSPAWFIIVLVAICLNYLVTVFFPSLPQW